MIDLFNLAIARKIGGGDSPGSVLQNKSLTITENGSQTITPDTGYDGLSRVDLSVNVSGENVPAVGFVPTEWDSDGYITNGRWYGTTVPDSALATSTTYNSYKHLQNVSLPDDLVKIGNAAFYTCIALALSQLPNSVKTIGANAFQRCTALQLSDLPAGLTTISQNAFTLCTGLTKITFHSKPSTMFPNIFSSCTNITEINVPWAEGEVANAPWGATNATINYNVTA